MKFCFHTLGCKVNRSETQALSQLAVARGHQIVEQDADICIVNTCTVTSTSDHKNIRAFHKARRENPKAFIAAVGCFSQMDPETVRAQPEIDLICGTSDRAAIIEKCERLASGASVQSVTVSAPQAFEPLPAGVPRGRTRALLKIQDGCDNYCAYCIIPYARGHVRSMPQQEVLQQVYTLREQGVREIVLTGIEISSYGEDFATQTDLASLIEQVCAAVPDVRIRLSSLEPRTASAMFCQKLSVLPNLMLHFHLSLQSGCDSVLARMKRKYTTAEYAASLERLRAVFPDCSITTDLIVGFPGETEAEHRETIAFLRRCAFADIHVFPYSVRRGTVAATMSGQIAPQVKAQRAKEAKQVAKSLAKQFEDCFIGRELAVLLEHPVSLGIWSGHASYHFQLHIATAHGARNRLMRAKITGRDGFRLLGKEI